MFFLAAELYVVLKRLCDLFMLDKLLADSRTLLETGFASGAQLRMLRQQASVMSLGCININAQGRTRGC